MYKVLIADDEPFILEGLSKSIPWGELSLEVTALVLGGEAAWEIVRLGGVDIVVTDIRMPKLDGLGLLRRIREAGLPVKCIVLSGYSDFPYVKECARLGIENYLLKPVNLEECLSTLEGVVAKLNLERRDRRIAAEGMQVLKDNILERWMSGRIGGEELRERCDLLDLRLDGGFRACILCWEEGPGGRAEALAEHCKRLLDAKGLGYAVAQPPGRILLALRGMDAPSSLECAQALLEELLRDAREQFQLEAMAVTGSYADDSADIGASLHQAAELLDYRYLRPDRRFLAYEEYLMGPGLSGPVARIVAYIEANYAKEMNLKTIAGELGMNALYLGQLFTGETGEHFTEYLNKRRIEHSKRFLRQNVSAKEAARLVGYVNPNYFYTVFKKYQGMSPNEYKAEHCK